MSKIIMDSDTFVQENFEFLVRKYPRQRIVICNGEIFTGIDAVRKARQKYPKLTPLSFPVPGKDEFSHIL